MQRRGPILLIFVLAMVSLAVVTTRTEVPFLLEGLVMASFAILGLFAVLLVKRSLHDLPTSERDTFDFNHLRDELRLAPREPPGPPEAPAGLRGPIEDFPSQPVEAEAKIARDALARQFTTRLATPASRPDSDERTAPGFQVLDELVREGEELQTLARLLKVDLTAYGKQLSKGLAAAQRGQQAECALILRRANDQLRARVQAALARELSTEDSPSAAERG